MTTLPTAQLPVKNEVEWEFQEGRDLFASSCHDRDRFGREVAGIRRWNNAAIVGVVLVGFNTTGLAIY